MIVLDASVIAKWFLEERGTSSALKLRERHLKKKEIILAPDIVIYELANLFRYKENFREEEIVSALDALENFKIEIVHLGFRDISKAAILAKHKDITVYDAAYILTALNFNCKFITADKKLYEKTKDLRFVKLL